MGLGFCGKLYGVMNKGGRMKRKVELTLNLVNSLILQFEEQYSKSFDISDAIALNNYRVQKDLLEDLLRVEEEQ